MMDFSKIERELATKDLHLRAPAISDSDSMHAMLSDPQTVKYWMCTTVTDKQASIDQLAENLVADEKGDSISWAVCLKDKNEMIGRCVLFHFDESNHHAEIGFILNRQYWRRGLMRQAAEAVIQFGFSTLDLHRIEADADPENASSLALLESLGFKREGYFPERWLIGGEWKDSVMLGLLKGGET